MVLLGIAEWVLVGLVVGFIASKVVDLHGDDSRLGMIAAAAGAVLGAAIYAVASGAGVSGWDVWALLWAAVGGVAGAVTWHAIRSRYVSRERYVPRRSY